MRARRLAFGVSALIMLGPLAYAACILTDVSELRKACVPASGCDPPYVCNVCSSWAGATPPGGTAWDAAVCRPALTCPPGTIDCGNCGCVDITTDPANCGACGKVCGDTFGIGLCVEGACRIECNQGTTLSEKGCVIMPPAFEGACEDVPCAEGFVCGRLWPSTLNGKSAYASKCHCAENATCGMGQCLGTPQDASDVNLTAGQVGICLCNRPDATACGEGEICNKDGCYCESEGGPCLYDLVPGDPDAGKVRGACCADGCRNLVTDTSNCGACGFGCPSGFSCIIGTNDVATTGENSCYCNDPGATAPSPEFDRRCVGSVIEGGVQELNVDAGCDPSDGYCVCNGVKCPSRGQRCTWAGCL
jgi:hypothetical protein